MYQFSGKNGKSVGKIIVIYYTNIILISTIFHVCYAESEVLALEEQSAEVFAEGIAITEESLDIEGSSGKPLEIWDHYLKWCMERLKDERSTEAMKKKVV